ncbi:KRAB [Mytilus coruscus]|uniref:KRAB n=1 Tax=Mytilus coruscus TaxID=42192 RepID=A0A6J8BDS4_MYTCO|nr:KRAB [Mytilus coruscus]
MEKQTENLVIEIKTEPSDNYYDNKNENCNIGHYSSHGNKPSDIDNLQLEGTSLTVPNIKTGTKLEDAVEGSPFRLSGRASFLYQKSSGDLNLNICGKEKDTKKSSNEIECPKYIEDTAKVKMISSEQEEIFIEHVEKGIMDKLKILKEDNKSKEIKADMPQSVIDFPRSSEPSGIENPNVNSRALLQYGSDLTETKIKRLDEIISEVRQNLELDPKFPKDQLPKASKISIEIKSSSNQSLDESYSSDDEKSEKFSNLKNVMEKMTKENLPRKPGKKGSIWSDDVFGQPGENRYICPSCGFDEHNEMQEHKESHSDQLFFACTRCGKEFSQIKELKSHRLSQACKTFEATVIADDDDDDDDEADDHGHDNDDEDDHGHDNDDKDTYETIKRQIGDNYTSIQQASNEKLLFACVKCGKEFSQMEDIQAHKMSQECSTDLSAITNNSSCDSFDDAIKQEPIDIIDTSCNTSDNSIENNEKLNENDHQNSVKKGNNSSLQEEEEHVCATCGMKFNEVSMLQDHFRLHSELEKLTSSYVAESEGQSNTDEAEKPFKCHLYDNQYCLRNTSTASPNSRNEKEL